MAANIDRVINKVEKLLALGTSSNEHEAALAVAKAQEILLAHGLEMEQVTGRKANRSDVIEAEAFDVFERGKTTKWRMDVLATVARTSGVWIARGYRSERIETKGKVRYAQMRTAYFIGLPADVEMAGYAYSFLIGEVERLAQAEANIAWAAIRQLAVDRGITVHDAESRYVWDCPHPLKVKASFTKGAAEGVSEMLLSAERTRATTADTSTTALVVNRDAIIRDYWYMKTYGMTYDEKQIEMREQIKADPNPNAVGKPLTPAQARKQQERDERAWRRESARQQRAEERKWANIDYSSYVKGQDAGRSMNVRAGIRGGRGSAPALDR